MTGVSIQEHETLYDSIVLAGVTSPGTCKLSGHKRDEAWDVKDGDGQGGASVTRKGEKLCKFTAAFNLADIADFSAWDDFLVLLKSCTAGKDPKALDIYHPDLAEIDVKSVVVESIGGKVHDGKGGATITVGFLEYRPAKPKGGSPKGSKSKDPKKAEAPDPNADAKAQLAALLSEAKRP